MNAHIPRNTRYYSLDFWRGVACLMVIVFHSTLYVATEALDDHILHRSGASLATWVLWMTSRLWIGVPMFFVISGYCIAASADSHRRHGHSPAQYFLRRLRRIYPPLWVFLAVFVLFVGCVESIWPGSFSDRIHPINRPWGLSLWQWVGSLTLTETWRNHVIGDKFGLLFGHMWTLCYEEQFYLVVGVLLSISRRCFFMSALGLTALVAVLCTIIPEPMVSGFFFDGLWLQFAAGMAVFYAVNYSSQRGRCFIVALFAVALISQLRSLSALVAFTGTTAQSHAVAFAFALLLLSLHRYDLHMHGALWTRPVSWCGQMCYSLYLVHWPIAKIVSHALFTAGVESPLATLLVTVPTSLTASALAGWIFHMTVEQRFLNAPQPRTGDRDQQHALSARCPQAQWDSANGGGVSVLCGSWPAGGGSPEVLARTTSGGTLSANRS